MRWSALFLISAMLCSCCFNVATAQRVPANWEIKGDATVVYLCRERAIAHKVVIPEANKRKLAAALRALAQRSGENLTDEQIDRKVAEQTAAAEAPVDTTPHSFVLTESVHGGSFLYKYVPDTSDPAFSTFGQNTVVYDGVQTRSRYSGSNPGSEVTIGRGLNGKLLSVFPVYCTQIASITVIRNIAQSGPNTYQAEVMHAGGGDSQITYMPATITADSNSAQAHISHITVFSRNLKYAEYELSHYVTSGAVVVPRQIHEVRYDTANGDVPYLEYDYTLQSVTDRSLDSSAFEEKSLLDSHSFILATAHGKNVTVPGYRDNMSVADQVEKAYIEKEAQRHSAPSGHNPSGAYLLVAIAVFICIVIVRRRLVTR